MASIFTILQLGDLHYDEFKRERTLNDAKDPRPPGGIPAAFDRPLGPVIANHLASRLRSLKAGALVVCGDLTSRGDHAVYKDALLYLSDIIENADSADLTENMIHLVPGNHDVDYRGSMPYVDIDLDRFNVLDDLVKNSKFQGPISTRLRAKNYSINGSKAAATIFSMNSCRGTGAPRSIPTLDIADPLAALLAAALGTDTAKLQQAITDVVNDNPDQLSHEILDIPLIHPSDLGEVQEALREASPASLPVLVAHHGFLPQAINRFNPYTEMVNGGQVRETLLKMNRPVLYLHGHVHRDSVETIGGGPGEPMTKGNIVAIAAPLLSEGYNEIVIEFDANGQALGIILRRYRVDKTDGQVRKQPSQRLPLVSRTLSEDKFRPLISYVYEKRIATGADVLEHANSKCKGATKLLTEAEVEDFMSRAVWQSLLEVAANTMDGPFAEREYMFR